MSRPLEGIRVIEVAMWAFVPASAGMLADLGAQVIKIEPPSGDPLRGLSTGMAGATSGVDLSWESYNRGKQSLTLDLKSEAGRAVLFRLLETADVFVTSLLPPARRAMGIDGDSLRARFPNLIYATGSALGQRGEEAERGGFDSISFWARSGIASSLTDEDAAHPASPPGPAFGDTLSAAMLAGGICAAIAKRAMTGEASVVDVSLLGAAMWSMQRVIAQSTLDGLDRFPRPAAGRPNNVLVNTYRTSDGRFLSLCMLQADRYWARLMELCGRPDLATDPRFADARARRDNVAACVDQLNALFASKALAEWREILGQQDGQWDVVQHVGELHRDGQVIANAYLQPVETASGQVVPLVSVPMQFDNAALVPAAAPDIGQDSDAILAQLGYDDDAIIALKVAGVVF